MTHELADDLLRWAEEEIRREESAQLSLLRQDVLAHHNTLFIVGGLIANIVAAAIIPKYMVAWIAASFFLYVLAPLLMLIPTDKKKVLFPAKEDLERYLEILREYGLSRNTRTLGQIIWNVFFINSQTIAIAYCLVFTVDIVFAIVEGFFTRGLPEATALQVIFQSVVIIVFFAGIWRYKPYSLQFAGSVQQMQDRLRARMREAWKLILVMGVISAGLAFLVVTAMLLPGFLLGEVVMAPDVVTPLTVFPIALIFLSQLVILRYLQGVYSKEMVMRMSGQKVQQLRGILRLLQASGDRHEESSEEIRRVQLEDLRKAFIKSRLFTTKNHAIFGYLTVYFVIPDFSLMLDRSVISEVDGTIPIQEFSTPE